VKSPATTVSFIKKQRKSSGEQKRLPTSKRSREEKKPGPAKKRSARRRPMKWAPGVSRRRTIIKEKTAPNRGVLVADRERRNTALLMRCGV